MSATIYGVAYKSSVPVDPIINRIAKDHIYNGDELMAEIIKAGGFVKVPEDSEESAICLHGIDQYDYNPVQYEGRTYGLHAWYDEDTQKYEDAYLLEIELEKPDELEPIEVDFMTIEKEDDDLPF